MTNAVMGASDIEAPTKIRAYFISAFASFGGILAGYDSGHINGVLDMPFVKRQFGHPVSMAPDEAGYTIPTPRKFLIVYILPLAALIGCLLLGSVAERGGRRFAIMNSCLIFSIGVLMQIISANLGLLVGGRFVAGLGLGGISTAAILYVSEIAPKRLRGAFVSGYQFAAATGFLLGRCIDSATEHLWAKESYRLPIAIQFVWALVLSVGISLLPESPRYHVSAGQLNEARIALARARCLPNNSESITAELANIQENYGYQCRRIKSRWIDCFKGGISLRGNSGRVIVGTSLQLFQQLTGVHCIFYYGTKFFQLTGLHNPFKIFLITNLLNVFSTPISFYAIENLGRRTLLASGAIIMLIFQFTIAIWAAASEPSAATSLTPVALVCLYIVTYASTWGPGPLVVISELFPLPIRAKVVALSMASNWFWSYIFAVITPFMVDADKGNLGTKVFFIGGSTCALSMVFSYFCIPETRGLSLEQVDCMVEESIPRKSDNWRPRENLASRMSGGANV